MSELQRLKGLLPPENQSWVFIEAAAAIDPPLITLEEIGRDEVEIQVDLEQWDYLAQDHRNLLFWHEVGRIQNDTIPRDGWEMAALAIGLGGAIGELWVQDGLLLLMALGLSGFAGYRLYLKNNSEKRLQDAISADERAIDLACRFGYSVPNAYKSLGGALKDLVEKSRKKKKRTFYEDRLEALRKVLKELAQKWHLKKDLKNQLRVKMFMDSSRLVELAAVACDDRKAGDIKLLKVDEVSSIADWILITEGLSDVQVRAIVNNVEKTIREEADLLPLRKGRNK